jgi:uncharacterized protein YdhG (YjbR/CyaY superfamily)
MKSEFATPLAYIQSLPDERKLPIEKLRNCVLSHLPNGFEEKMCYGMLGYVVPHSIYPNGYHCDPKQALPFINIASQKNFIVLHHLGLYANEQLLNWFVSEYPKHTNQKIDMGKGCVRFKKMESIPYELIQELVSKISVTEWISFYENNLIKK